MRLRRGRWCRVDSIRHSKLHVGDGKYRCTLEEVRLWRKFIRRMGIAGRQLQVSGWICTCREALASTGRSEPAPAAGKLFAVASSRFQVAPEQGSRLTTPPPPPSPADSLTTCLIAPVAHDPTEPPGTVYDRPRLEARAEKRPRAEPVSFPVLQPPDAPHPRSPPKPVADLDHALAACLASERSTSRQVAGCTLPGTSRIFSGAKQPAAGTMKLYYVGVGFHVFPRPRAPAC